MIVYSHECLGGEESECGGYNPQVRCGRETSVLEGVSEGAPGG